MDLVCPFFFVYGHGKSVNMSKLTKGIFKNGKRQETAELWRE